MLLNIFIAESCLEKQVSFHMTSEREINWNPKICGTADNAAVISDVQS